MSINKPRMPKGSRKKTRVIRIDEAVWNLICDSGRDSETPNDVLRRLLLGELGNADIVSAACPRCSESTPDNLIWQDDETVHCTNCGTRYEPAAAK